MAAISKSPFCPEKCWPGQGPDYGVGVKTYSFYEDQNPLSFVAPLDLRLHDRDNAPKCKHLCTRGLASLCRMMAGEAKNTTCYFKSGQIVTNL